MVLLIAVIGFWVYREKSREKERGKYADVATKESQFKESSVKDMEVNLMADVSDCLDKYKVYTMEQLWEATDGFNENCLIQGSVYKGSINGEMLAIKKLKWNAREELKILQKVNSNFFTLFTISSYFDTSLDYNYSFAPYFRKIL